MKLYQVVLKDVMRRKKRVLYATLGVVIGTMTVVAILTVALAGQSRIYSQMEKYGANLMVVPAVRSVSAGLGDLALGTVNVDGTVFDAETGKGIRGPCVAYPKAAVKYDVRDGRMRMTMDDLTAAFRNTLNPRLS